MRELGLDLMSVGLQGLDIAVRTDLVREVLGARAWIPIPGARPDVPGVVLWGGRAVGVVDLGRFHPSLRELSGGQERPRLVVVALAGYRLALPVDRVSEVFRTHDDNLKPRELSDFALARQEVVLGDRVLPLLDAELLLRRLNVEVAA